MQKLNKIYKTIFIMVLLFSSFAVFAVDKAVTDYRNKIIEQCVGKKLDADVGELRKKQDASYTKIVELVKKCVEAIPNEEFVVDAHETALLEAVQKLASKNPSGGSYQYQKMVTSEFKKSVNLLSFQCSTPELDCHRNLCCDGLSCQGTLTVTKTRNCAKNFKQCTKDDDCCSNNCKIDSKTNKGFCDFRKVCVQQVGLGEKCKPGRNSCKAGECREVDPNKTLLDICTQNERVCSNNEECCSGTCAKGQGENEKRCQQTFRCRKPCAEQGHKPSKDKECCEGLYESFEGICIPDFPPFGAVSGESTSVVAIVRNGLIQVFNSGVKFALNIFSESAYAGSCNPADFTSDDEALAQAAEENCSEEELQSAVNQFHEEANEACKDDGISELAVAKVARDITEVALDVAQGIMDAAQSIPCIPAGCFPYYHHSCCDCIVFNNCDWRCDPFPENCAARDAAIYAASAPLLAAELAHWAADEWYEGLVETCMEKRKKATELQSALVLMGMANADATAKAQLTEDANTMRTQAAEATETLAEAFLTDVSTDPELCVFNSAYDFFAGLDAYNRQEYLAMIGFESVYGNSNNTTKDVFIEIHGTPAAAGEGGILSKDVYSNVPDGRSMQERLAFMGQEIRTARSGLMDSLTSEDRNMSCECIKAKGASYFRKKFEQEVADDRIDWFKDNCISIVLTNADNVEDCTNAYDNMKHDYIHSEDQEAAGQDSEGLLADFQSKCSNLDGFFADPELEGDDTDEQRLDQTQTVDAMGLAYLANQVLSYKRTAENFDVMTDRIYSVFYEGGEQGGIDYGSVAGLAGEVQIRFWEEFEYHITTAEHVERRDWLDEVGDLGKTLLLQLGATWVTVWNFLIPGEGLDFPTPDDGDTYWEAAYDLIYERTNCEDDPAQDWVNRPWEWDEIWTCYLPVSLPNKVCDIKHPVKYCINSLYKFNSTIDGGTMYLLDPPSINGVTLAAGGDLVTYLEANLPSEDMPATSLDLSDSDTSDKSKIKQSIKEYAEANFFFGQEEDLDDFAEYAFEYFYLMPKKSYRMAYPSPGLIGFSMMFTTIGFDLYDALLNIAINARLRLNQALEYYLDIVIRMCKERYDQDGIDLNQCYGEISQIDIPIPELQVYLIESQNLHTLQRMVVSGNYDAAANYSASVPTLSVSNGNGGTMEFKLSSGLKKAAELKEYRMKKSEHYKKTRGKTRYGRRAIAARDKAYSKFVDNDSLRDLSTKMFSKGGKAIFKKRGGSTAAKKLDDKDGKDKEKIYDSNVDIKTVKGEGLQQGSGKGADADASGSPKAVAATEEVDELDAFLDFLDEEGIAEEVIGDGGEQSGDGGSLDPESALYLSRINNARGEDGEIDKDKENLIADLNGDGIVTEEELLKFRRWQERRRRSREISPREGNTLFKIITKRYIRSGYRRLLKKKLKTKK